MYLIEIGRLASIERQSISFSIFGSIKFSIKCIIFWLTFKWWTVSFSMNNLTITRRRASLSSWCRRYDCEHPIYPGIRAIDDSLSVDEQLGDIWIKLPLTRRQTQRLTGSGTKSTAGASGPPTSRFVQMRFVQLLDILILLPNFLHKKTYVIVLVALNIHVSGQFI